MSLLEGSQQARALGEYFKDTHFIAILASPLRRAFSTAQALQDGQDDPKPPLTSSPLLREQHFGVAEGKPWDYRYEPNLSLEEHIAMGKFPVIHSDEEKFPGGESTNDLAIRANQAIEELILPHVQSAARQGLKGVHIAVVSHGLCISQLIAMLLKKDASGAAAGDYRGLLNTAWTRVTIDVKVCRHL